MIAKRDHWSRVRMDPHVGVVAAVFRASGLPLGSMTLRRFLEYFTDPTIGRVCLLSAIGCEATFCSPWTGLYFDEVWVAMDSKAMPDSTDTIGRAIATWRMVCT